MCVAQKNSQNEMPYDVWAGERVSHALDCEHYIVGLDLRTGARDERRARFLLDNLSMR